MNKQFYKKISFLIILVAMNLLASSVMAQTSQNDLIIDDIIYKVEGPKEISEASINVHMKLRKGMKFDQTALDQSIRSLYTTGLYDFVEAQRSLNAAGKMVIELKIVPKYRISTLVFSGNRKYKTSKLQDQISSYAGSLLNEIQVKRDADKIREYYVKKGYSMAKVDYKIERNDAEALGAVLFEIDEGQDIKIQNIRFTGTPELEKDHDFWDDLFPSDDKPKGIITADDLLSRMKTDTWIWLISYLTDNGLFKEDEFQTDLETIRTVFRNNGYLDVEVDESKVKFEFPDEDNPGDMDIVIAITPNKQYKVGNVSFKGNTLIETNVLMEFIEAYDLTSGNPFSPARVNEAIDKIRIYYGEFGYIETIVRALRRPNLQTGDIDLIIEIIESDKYYLESINIQGNTKTKSEVIIRELALSPGGVFDLARMKTSEARLKNTRFFDEVTLSPEYTNIPNRRNLRIAVKEGRTGNLTFGAGFSTVESLVATVEVTQSNFDYENYDNYFQGAGQKFRIRGTIGLESNQVILSYENPWVFNRELSYGVDLYRTDSDYYSDYYSETRLGMQNYLRKRIFELVEAKLSYTLELIDIYDVSSDAPSVISDEEGSRSLSQVSLSFLRDNRDNYMMPTKGTRFELIQDIAGGPLMGQTNLYRIEGRAGWWIPTFDTGKQVFSIVGRTGTVMGYDNKDVPFFEMFFLGGAYNMRGFEYRTVGPIDPDTGEPLGGSTFAFISVEYSVEIFDPLRLAVFYDAGFVNSGEWDWDPSDYNSDFGIGARIMIMGAPMRIDLGFPLKTGEYNDNGMQFNFSFGTVF